MWSAKSSSSSVSSESRAEPQLITNFGRASLSAVICDTSQRDAPRLQPLHRREGYELMSQELHHSVVFRRGASSIRQRPPTCFQYLGESLACDRVDPRSWSGGNCFVAVL